LSDSLGIISAVVVAEVIPGAIALYAAYWAFSMRKALAGRMYGRHASLLGYLCVVVSILGFITYSTDQTINALLTLFSTGGFVFVFAFIDSTVPLARRSDPLLRSVLGWDKLRIALWIDTGILVVVNVLTQLFYSANWPLILNILWFASATILFGASGMALVIGARRSRDPFFQKSLKWLGLALIFAVMEFVPDTAISFLVPNVTQFDFYYSYYAVPSGLAAIAVAYLLYRTARSLAPISSLAESDPESSPQVGTAKELAESPVPGAT
jgi:hypothetical protein